MKGQIHFLTLIFLTSFTLSQSVEKIITLSDPEGDTFLAISETDTFVSVIEDLKNYYSTLYPDAAAQLNLNLSLSNHAMVVRSPSVARDYNRKLSSTEKSNIEYIITHMAYDDLSVLWKNRSKMRKIGESLEVSIHPLKFLETILTSEKMNAGAKSIYDRTLLGAWVWKEFSEGCEKILAYEYKQKNILAFLPEFAEKIEVDFETLKSLAEKESWSKFVEKAVTLSPRSSKADRYNDM